MKTLNHFRNQLARSYGHLSWAQVKNKVRRSELDVSDLVAFCDEANRLYYEHEIERLKAERWWISVKDRLPEKNGDYLCYLIHDNPKCDNRITTIIWVNMWSNVIGDNCVESYSVTHWMPLPEPPRQ